MDLLGKVDLLDVWFHSPVRAHVKQVQPIQQVIRDFNPTSASVLLHYFHRARRVPRRTQPLGLVTDH